MKLFTLLLPALFSSIIAGAATIEVEGITYTTNDDGNTCALTDGRYVSGDIVIPSTVTDEDGKSYTVTSIDKPGFGQNKNIGSVTLPSTIKSIGRVVFADSSLKNIMMQEGVEDIGYSCFDGCSDLESIVIPNSVKELGSYSSLTGLYGQAFANCSSLKSVTLPAGLTVLRENTFKGCSALESIVLPENLTMIENHVFDGCMSLTGITIPAGVTSIGDACFMNCRAMKEVVLPAGLTEIAPSLFLYCVSLENVNIPKNVTVIGRQSFAECYQLQAVKIPDAVEHIATDAFGGCCSVKTVDMGTGVKRIGHGTLAFFDIDDALHYIWKITDITVRATEPPVYFHEVSLTDLPADFFIATPDMPEEDQAAYLASITLHVPAESVEAYRKADQWKRIANIVAIEDEPQPTTITHDGMIFKIVDDATCELIDATAASGDVVIPEKVSDEQSNDYEVVSIARSAFASNVAVTSVSIPDIVTAIDAEAFSGCTSLVTVTMPDNLTTFGDGCFRNCSALKTVKLPSALQNLPKNAFLRCNSLVNIELGADLKTVNSGAMAVMSIQDRFSLRSITVNATVPPVYSDGKNDEFFFGTTGASEQNSKMFLENLVLYVPEGSVDAYKSALPWSLVGKIRKIGDTAISDIESENALLSFDGDVITADGIVEVYSMTGTRVAVANGTLSVAQLPAGVYIAKAGDDVVKIIVR